MSNPIIINLTWPLFWWSLAIVAVLVAIAAYNAGRSDGGTR